MTVHELKTWPIFFQAVRGGLKRFEVRKNDRGFEGGDYLRLQEWDPETGAYTGEEDTYLVTCVLSDFAGIEPGYVVMSIQPVSLLKEFS